jgi:tight adherence protein B
MSPPVIALLIFAAALFLLGAAIFAVNDALRARRARATAGGSGQLRLRRIRPSKTVGSIGGPVTAFDRWFSRLVQETGLGWDPGAAALLMVLCGLLTGAALFLWNEELLPAAIGILLGVPLPAAYLVVRRWRRVRLLQDQLAPALEILARSVRAGQTLDQAIGHLGGHSPEPLATEFRFCARQLEMGLGMPAVMRGLVGRLQMYDVRIFATTLIVHRQAGGNIAAVLDRLARVIRDRLSYRRQLRAVTAGGRISAGLVSLITPALFLFFILVRPTYIASLLHSPLGQSLLVLTVFLEVVGLIWTARLLRPAY